MKKGDYRLKGHESFACREGWLTKGIRAVPNNNKLFSKNSGADELGVGTNMAKSIRYWLRAANITNDSPNKGVFLSELGELVNKYDLYFEDQFTLWIAHCNIASNFKQATSWNIFFNGMNLSSAFSREEMFELMKTLLEEKIGESSLSDRSIKDDCTMILSMYTRNESFNDDPEEKKNCPFEELNLIQRVGNKYLKRRPNLGSVDELVILYLLVDHLNSEKSMAIDFATDGNNMPGKLLNINRIMINEYLDSLQNHGYITVNRTAGLDMIYPAKCEGLTKCDVVRMYYERSRK